MPRPHFYSGLDRDDKLTLEIDMRSLAERLDSMNYGAHRLLSHLIDVRRERHQAKIAAYTARGDNDIAENVRREGDRLADGIEELLNRGLY